MIKAAIFDLDGTLAYTFDDIRSSIDDMRAAYGVEPISDEKMTEIVNYVARDFAKFGLGLDKEPTEQMIDEALAIYTEAYDRHYLDTTRIYDGLPEVMETLKKNGMKLAVYSNKIDAYVKMIMTKLYGHKLFDVLMGPDGITPKPDPMGALMIADKWGLKPEEVVFVGDSILDMKTGVSAGMTPIAVSWGYTKVENLKAAGAKYIVDTRPELEELLLNLMK